MRTSSRISALLLTMLATLTLLTACKETDSPHGSPGTEPGIQTTPITKAELSAAATTLAQDNATFAFDLYRRLATADGNIFFSPWSISTAFGMAYGGAREKTAEQMAEAMRFSLAPNLLHPAFKQLDATLEEAQAEGNVRVNIANSLWPQQDYPFLDSYLSLIEASYDSEITAVDYKTEAAAARLMINGWVEEKTEDKIQDLIPSGVLNKMTRMVLVNAIYFLGSWEKSFNPKRTYDSSFYGGSNKPTPVKMMSQTEVFGYADLDSLQLLQLPYKESDLSMLVLLPAERGGLQRLESSLTAANLALWSQSLTERKVAVSLPRFEMTSQFELGESLQEMGMVDAFNPGAADFSGMDGQPGWLFIGAAIHKAFVDVNELGTEAAAATALVMVATSIPDWPTFRADHPFIFLIQDDRTGSILFIGRLLEPEAGA
jgi:serpin B